MNRFRLWGAWCDRRFDLQEKYGPKGQGKVSNGTPAKPNKDAKQQPDFDITVGLTKRPPWFCRYRVLCWFYPICGYVIVLSFRNICSYGYGEEYLCRLGIRTDWSRLCYDRSISFLSLKLNRTVSWCCGDTALACTLLKLALFTYKPELDYLCLSCWKNIQRVCSNRPSHLRWDVVFIQHLGIVQSLQHEGH